MKKQLTFSQRNGYTSIDEVIIREDFPEVVTNSICSIFEYLKSPTYRNPTNLEFFNRTEMYVWQHFFNFRYSQYYVYLATSPNQSLIIDNFLDPNNQWFEKLDLLEFIIRNMNDIDPSYASHLKNQFVLNINREFERLSYSYRIIDDLIVEVTSEAEINTINDAIEKSTENIKIHLSNALQSLAIRPKPDCRTSIKESIH